MSSEWQVTPVPELRGYTVEWLEPGRVFLSRRNRIYKASAPTARPEPVGTVEAPAWRSFVSRARLAQRLLRFMVYNLLPLLDEEILVTFDTRVGLLSSGSYQDLQGIERPSRVLRRGCAVDTAGDVYWGEYLSNPDREGVRVYRYRAGSGRAEVAHLFGAGEIRHVHGIYRDPYTESLWCLTGDRQRECRILITEDGFSTLETVGAGDETWRAVSMLFTREAVYYASDAEFRPNHIYRLDRQTGERTCVAQLDGPVYYSHVIGKSLFFATTAELCPSQEAPQATLWLVEDSTSVSKVLSLTKDLFRRHLTAMAFMPGTLHFPLGPGLDSETYFSGVGLEGADNLTLRLHRQARPS